MPKKLGLTSVVMIISIWIFFVHQMIPSPLLIFIQEYYQIYNNDALLNLAVSIMFPSIIVASLLGGSLEKKTGTKHLFTLASIFVALGLVLNFVADSYIVFLAGRFLYGIGFGFSLPFVGSAIMSWYTGKQRYLMTTINGLFPFVGTVVAFGLAVPLYMLLNSSLKLTFGIWTIPVILILIAWFFMFTKEKTLPQTQAESTGEQEPEQASEQASEQTSENEKGLYWGLLKRKNIRLLSFIYLCDYLVFSYIAVILPVYLYEFSGISESMAGLLAAIAFPAVGIFGAAIGGVIMTRTGLNKPPIIAAQLFKLFGGIITALGSSISLEFTLVGVFMFGIGNSLWIPAMYSVPMELERMNSTRVGASYSLMMSFGFVVGFIGPIVGGFITNQLMLISGIADPLANHVFGLRWSLFAFSMISIIAFICSLRMTETGPKAKAKKEKGEEGEIKVIGA